MFLCLFIINLGWAQATKDTFLLQFKEYHSLNEALEKPLSVEYLNLKQEKIKEFPSEIYSFKNLKALTLRSNKLKAMPDSINKLEQLEYLDLGSNLFEDFPIPILTIKTLKILIITNNLIHTIPAQISNLTNLEKLIIWGTECKTLPDEIYTLKGNLKVLDIRLTPIQNEAERTKIEEQLPNTTILFPAPCNCMSN